MIVLKKLMPAPLWSVALLTLWLVLARSVSAGHVLLGLVLALVVPRVTATLRPPPGRVRQPLVIARYLLVVAFDVVRANVEVAWGVIVSPKQRPQTRFVVIPLDLRDPVGLAVLAMVTTVVPGTVWSELAADRRAFMLHVWDVTDERTFVAGFKARYEQPLREVFE